MNSPNSLTSERRVESAPVEAAPLLTVLVLSDGDSAAAELSASSAAPLADDVLVLERSTVDWTDGTVISETLRSVSAEWVLVLGAGERLRISDVGRARTRIRDGQTEAVGVQVGLSGEVRLHRAVEDALAVIGSPAADICRDLSIAVEENPRGEDGPAVSVIVPTFNRPVLLRRCLEGLCVQTTSDFEVIVVNDGGLDVTEVVDDFTDRLDIALITQAHNGGAAMAANSGLAAARGRYAHFQADDDTIFPQHLELLRSALDSTRDDDAAAGVAYGPAFLVEESPGGVETDRRIIFQEPQDTDRLMSQNFIVGGTAMFDRFLAQDIGGMDTGFEVLEDWDFWLRMAERADLIYVDVPTAEYRIREGTANVTTQAKPRFYSNLLRLYDAHQVDPGSLIAERREEQILIQSQSHKDSHAWEHTVVVVGDGDLTQLVGCLQSVTEVLSDESFQLIIHELRSAAAEEILADIARDATVCLHSIADDSLVMGRIERQAGGRRITVLRSSERLVASPLPETMSEALTPRPLDSVALAPVPFDPETIGLDYEIDSVSRYGYGRPSHSGIQAILANGRDRYAAVLDEVAGHLARLAAIAVGSPPSVLEPYWNNDFFMGLDAAVLYTMVASGKPKRYLEIGSGNSTRFVRQAINDHGLDTTIISIDPEPRAECDELCDMVVRSALEATSPEVFKEVEAGDIVFFDGSHRSLMNSDVTVFFLEILPRLPEGTLVHIHDVFLPDDYPPGWAQRLYSEQYLLAARLLAPEPGFDVVFPAAYVLSDAELLGRTSEVWNHPDLAEVRAGWGSFWLRTR